ncbi:MAG TPA: hypothetical protein VD833_04015 [Vicinamibacterales bacterium]|nr:hypothetical protein [Vicinamibacterales bacterium]
MKDFAIRMTHKPGELARVATALARYGVNVKSLAALAMDGHALVHILPDEEEAARAALTASGIAFDETEVVTVLLENRAGEIARVTARLGDARVNLRAIYVTGVVDNLVELAIVAGDAARVREAMADTQQ